MLVTSNYYSLGGFWALTLKGNKGDTHRFGSNSAIARAKVAHREVCVAGSERVIKYPEGAAPFPIIKTGDNSDARPDLVPGTYVRECLEDGTVVVGVCGMGQPFGYQWIDLNAGDSLIVPAGAVVSLSGSFELDKRPGSGQQHFLAEVPRTLIARARVLGVMIWAT